MLIQHANPLSLGMRFDKSAWGAMIVIMQRLHEDDLIVRLRDEDGWEYLAMPSELSERGVFDLGANASTFIRSSPPSCT